MINFSGVRNPVFASADGRMIACQVQFAHLPGWAPFSASADDSEAHGRAIHAAALAGDFGPVGAYVAPVLSVDVLRSLEYAKRGATPAALVVALWEYAVEGRTDATDQLQAIRDQVKLEFPK